MPERFQSVSSAHDWLNSWLSKSAFPVWEKFGIDWESGGFYEKLSVSYKPSVDPRRTRVVGRQIYCFAQAAKQGWTANAEACVHLGLKFLMGKSISPEGVAYSSVHSDGVVADANFDLYDQAFALFGLAAAASAIPEQRDSILATARNLRDRLVSGWKHPDFGFEEGSPRRLPLLANPHMHLFEAFLELKTVDPKDETWRHLADEIGVLAIERLIDGEIGCLREYFDENWRPHSGDLASIIEPGHQFEWTWLLCQWRPVDPKVIQAAERLCHIGENYGVDAERDVAIGVISDALTPRDKATRIWAQCERVKAHVAMATIARGSPRLEQSEEFISRAVSGLRPFLLASAPGLWRDRMSADGRLLDEDAPASSFYHIVFAASELNRYVQDKR